MKETIFIYIEDMGSAALFRFSNQEQGWSKKLIKAYQIEDEPVSEKIDKIDISGLNTPDEILLYLEKTMQWVEVLDDKEAYEKIQKM